MTQVVTIDDVRAAQDVIRPHLHRTPMLRSSQLAALAGADLSLKGELFQKTGSFKPRGVLNRLRHLTDDERARGLVTVSAGNHAQALAWGAAQAGVACTVCMPANASPSKAAAARGYGATVVLHGVVNETFAKAQELVERDGLVMIHPFDDPRIVAGAGTVGAEIVEDVPDVDVVICPVGGGGLIAGVSVAVKALRPSARIIGVEPTGASAMCQSWERGEPVRLDAVDTVADGLSAPMAGAIPYELTRALVDEMIAIPDAEILAGMEALMTYAKLFAEPAAGAATGALLAGHVKVAPGERVVAIVSGGNLDLSRLASF